MQIHVSSTQTIYVDADIARVSVRVSARGVTGPAAQEAVGPSSNRLHAAIEAAGSRVTERNMSTSEDKRTNGSGGPVLKEPFATSATATVEVLSHAVSDTIATLLRHCSELVIDRIAWSVSVDHPVRSEVVRSAASALTAKADLTAGCFSVPGIRPLIISDRPIEVGSVSGGSDAVAFGRMAGGNADDRGYTFTPPVVPVSATLYGLFETTA